MNPDHAEVLAAALARAKGEYDLNRMRAAMFGASLSGDPAWNMLLDLFISAGAGRRLSVSAVCIGSGVSHATATRYLNLLGDAELVTRTADDLDGRRTFIDLTAHGRDCMLSLLAGG